MKKITRIGKVPCGTSLKHSLFCKVEIQDGKLSISGVIGPKTNGDAFGSCGQVDMEFAHRNPEDNYKRYSNLTQPEDIEFAPGWNREMWLDFLDIWHKWHLNDMKAGCIHQTGPQWTGKDVTLYHFRLTESASEAKESAKKSAIAALKAGKTFRPTPDQVKVANLEYSYVYHSAELPKEVAPFYEPKKSLYAGDKGATETKNTGWLRPDEHPEGFLCKPCPVCGYRYGTQWRRVELPQEVITFLQQLPETDVKPAWV